MKTIGERIKQRREELNMSQDELAKKLGYKSRSSVNKIENGERNITQSKIKTIADALDTTPSYVMGWIDSPSKENTTIFDDMYDEDIKNKKWTWLDENEQNLIISYRDFDEEKKRQMILMLEFLKDQHNKK